MRMIIAGALAIGAVASGALLPARPSVAAPAETVQLFVDPPTASPGQPIRIVAMCSNSGAGWTWSAVFPGQVAMAKQPDGRLMAEVTINPKQAAGNYPISVRCEKGAQQSTEVTIQKMPSGGGKTGGGGLANGAGGGATLSLSAGLALLAGGVLLLVFYRRRASA